MNRIKIYLLAAVASLLLCLFLSSLPQKSFLNLINLKGRDLFFKIRNVTSPVPVETSEFLLVTIDDETLGRLHTRWPYPRSVYADLLNRLKPYSPQVIGFDFIFSGPDYSATSDQVFSEALESSQNVVLAIHQNSSETLGASSGGLRVWQQGIVDKPRDPDQVIRRFQSSFQVMGSVIPSWEAALYQKINPTSTPSLWANQNQVIDYRAGFEDFPRVPLWRILEGSVLAKDIQHKIILIGPTAEVFHDNHLSPIGKMPGVAINANVLLMLMRKTFFSEISKIYVYLFWFLSLWLAFVAGFLKPAFKAIRCMLGVCISFIGLSYFLFLNDQILDVALLIVFMFLVVLCEIVFRYTQIRYLEHKLGQEELKDGFYSSEFLTSKLDLEFKKIFFGMRSKDLCLIKMTFQNPQHLSHIWSAVRREELVCRNGDDLFIILPNTSFEDAKRFRGKLNRVLDDIQVRTISAKQSKIDQAKTLIQATV